MFFVEKVMKHVIPKRSNLLCCGNVQVVLVMCSLLSEWLSRAAQSSSIVIMLPWWCVIIFMVAL